MQSFPRTMSDSRRKRYSGTVKNRNENGANGTRTQTVSHHNSRGRNNNSHGGFVSKIDFMAWLNLAQNISEKSWCSLVKCLNSWRQTEWACFGRQSGFASLNPNQNSPYACRQIWKSIFVWSFLKTFKNVSFGHAFVEEKDFNIGYKCESLSYIFQLFLAIGTRFPRLSVSQLSIYFFL